MCARTFRIPWSPRAKVAYATWRPRGRAPVLHYSRHLGITSLRQPARYIGEEAARLMALRLGHDTMPARQVFFSAELVVRASTAGVHR